MTDPKRLVANGLRVLYGRAAIDVAAWLEVLDPLSPPRPLKRLVYHPDTRLFPAEHSATWIQLIDRYDANDPELEEWYLHVPSLADHVFRRPVNS